MASGKTQWNVRVESDLAEQVRLHCSQPGSPSASEYTETALRAFLPGAGPVKSAEGHSAPLGPSDASGGAPGASALAERFQQVVLRLAEVDMHIKSQDLRFEQILILIGDLVDSNQALAREVRLLAAQAQQAQRRD